MMAQPMRSFVMDADMAIRPSSELRRWSSESMGTRTANEDMDKAVERAKVTANLLPASWIREDTACMHAGIVMAKGSTRPERPRTNDFRPDLMTKAGSILTPMTKITYMRPNVAMVSSTGCPLAGKTVFLKVWLRHMTDGPRIIPPCKWT